MPNRENTDSVCRSVFKSGRNADLKKRFTKKWVELINRLEKDKAAGFR